MTYSHNPSDPLVLLAATANTLMSQYETQAISLDEFKTQLNSQIVSQFANIDKSSFNDDAYSTLTKAVAYVNAID